MNKTVLVASETLVIDGIVIADHTLKKEPEGESNLPQLPRPWQRRHRLPYVK